MKIKTIYYSLAIAALLGVGAFAFMATMNSTPDTADAKIGTPAQKKSHAAVSIFDYELKSSGKKSAAPRDAGPAHAHNPINPATGKKYTDAAMARFDLLRDEFPGNRMIPRRRSPREIKKALSKEQKLARKYYITTRIKILMGKASRPVIDDYFTFRLRFTKDKVRLLEYALLNMPEDASPARRKRVENLLRENRLKLERALHQKRTAYKKSGISEQARL